MADSKNKNKRKISVDTKNFQDIQKITAGRTYGVDQTFFNDIEEDRERIKKAIKDVNERHNEIAGNGYIEFFTSMIFEEDKNNKNKNNSNNTPSVESQKAFNNLLSSTNSVSLGAMFENEKERINLYDEYESVMNFIPQVYQAIDAIADAILSPDDYSKDILSAFYDGTENPSTEEHKKILKNISLLEDKYKFEDKLKKIIFKSLYLGDSFVLVSSLKKEFNKILTEDAQIYNESISLSESNFNISEEEISAFRELFLEEENTEKINKKLTAKEERANKVNKAQSDKKLKKDIISMFNNNVEFTNNSSSLFEKEIKLAKEFKTTPIQSDYESIIRKKVKEMNNDDISSSLLFTNVDEKEKKRHYTAMNNTSFEDGKGKKVTDTDITGSYIKVLDPSRIVKLRMGSTCFGYFYIETELPNRKAHSSITMSSRLTDFKLKNPVDIANSNVDEELNNPKIKLITDIFGRALASKVDKKFVEDNREFKTIIYELLKQEYITKKRIRIVYLGPDEVFHFKPEEGEDGYGVSKLEKVLFTCKIYIATLVTNLMMKLSRSADHRAFYVETGLSKDIEGTVQSFMRDIKSKEVKLNDLQTIDTIFRSIGQLIIADGKVF